MLYVPFVLLFRSNVFAFQWQFFTMHLQARLFVNNSFKLRGYRFHFVIFWSQNRQSSLKKSLPSSQNRLRMKLGGIRPTDKDTLDVRNAALSRRRNIRIRRWWTPHNCKSNTLLQRKTSKILHIALN